MTPATEFDSGNATRTHEPEPPFAAGANQRASANTFIGAQKRIRREQRRMRIRG